jgi:hypothetical protein
MAAGKIINSCIIRSCLREWNVPKIKQAYCGINLLNSKQL